jgi:thiamine biosynthesis lipoprotein
MLRAFVLFVVLALPARAEVYLTQEQALRLAFPAASARAERQTSFSETERSGIRERCGASEAPATLAWWRFERAGELLGYACIDEVLGKAQPITFLVCTDPQLRIRSVEILAYRESHGGEIRRADWRAQFVGKDAGSPLRVGRDVKNIAGATISCRSLTNGVRVRLEALRRAVAREPRAQALPVEAASPAGGAGLRRCQLLMGTTLAITLDAPGEAALEAAFAEVRRLEALLSDWQPGSELSALNRSGAGAIGPELEQVLGLALETSEQSQGGFDASVGPLVLLWRAARASGVPPEATACARAADCVGWRSIELDRAAHRARLAKPGMALDLGGIGKGYALDRAAAVLRQHGCQRALLDFGGQLLALDAPQGRSGWPVAVRDPRGGEHPLFEIELRAASLSTTADDQQGFVLDGHTYSHVFDPRSGTPVAGRLAACVLAAEGARADAWSTALYVLGAEAGLPLAERAGLAALVLEGDGSLHETESLKRQRRERP